MFRRKPKQDQKNDSEVDANICFVGDGSVGKTCLLLSYTTNEFPQVKYTPTVFDNYSASVLIDGYVVNVGLADTAGQEDYDHLRPLSYSQADVFLMLFSINSRQSFENVVSKWAPEIRRHAPKVPVLLVGSKLDLRVSAADGGSGSKSCSSSDFVSQEEAFQVVEELSYKSYFECSALTGENLKTVFTAAIKTAKEFKSKRRKGFFSRTGNWFSCTSTKGVSR